jgi:hypothetical protein
MLFERRAFDGVYGDDEDLELGGLDERLQLVGLTASQSCRSSALCRREVGGVLERGAQLQAAVRRRCSMGVQAGVDWSSTRAGFFVFVSSPGRSSQCRLKASLSDETRRRSSGEKGLSIYYGRLLCLYPRGSYDLSRPCLPLYTFPPTLWLKPATDSA